MQTGAEAIMDEQEENQRNATSSYRLLYRGERVNAILAISMQGVVAYRTMTGSVNGTTFYDFVTEES